MRQRSRSARGGLRIPKPCAGCCCAIRQHCVTTVVSHDARDWRRDARRLRGQGRCHQHATGAVSSVRRAVRKSAGARSGTDSASPRDAPGRKSGAASRICTRKEPILTTRDIRAAAKKARARKKAAAERKRLRPEARARRDATVQAHLYLVPVIARTIHDKLPSQFALDDLIGIGNIALVESAAKYDPKSHDGIRFDLYARSAIRGAMLDACRRKQFTENSRPSIDDPGSQISALISASAAGNSPRYETEAQRAFARMATTQQLDDIDRARLLRRVAAEIACLPASERRVVEAIYSVNASSIAKTARKLRTSAWVVKELRRRAIAILRGRLIPGTASPRASTPEEPSPLGRKPTGLPRAD